MRKTSLLLLCGLLKTLASFAGDPYAVSAIPAELLVNAHAVKRLEEERFELVSSHEAYLHRKFAITVLDEEGRRRAVFAEYYDQFRKIQDVEGTLYDAQGKQQRRLKGKDMEDMSATSEVNLMDDSRVKVHRFVYPTYPYTVEYEVTIRYNSSFFFPTWMPQDGEYLSVEKSSFTFVSNSDSDYRFLEANIGKPATVRTEDGKQVRSWSVSGLPAIKRPFASPLWDELTPVLRFAPNRFEISGQQGDSRDWASFGQFMSRLNSGRDALPETLKQKVRQLTEGVTDNREKVRRLYEYMQQNSRYISIQLGIGGWQPFEAKTVAEKGYGDCKALSNYMFSLLKEAGIRAHYTLVRAGYGVDARTMQETFASNQFNHAILCVPMGADSMWLECTSQTLPAGYTSGFTGNRKALLITDEGGKLAATPRYSWRENTLVRKATGTLDAEGNLELTIHTRLRAEQQDQLFQLTKALSADRLKKYLNGQLEFPSYEVKTFTYTPHAGILPELEEELGLSVRAYASVSGKRLFITPNVANREKNEAEEENRTMAIRLGEEFSDVDSVEITVPAGYVVESLPRAQKLATRYGTYETSTVFRDNKVLYVRRRCGFAGTFPATEWAQVREFFSSIDRADHSQVVLVKQ
ncbi:DUF3857 domain-containing protein [Flaviaesturariibacter terrae]